MLCIVGAFFFAPKSENSTPDQPRVLETPWSPSIFGPGAAYGKSVTRDGSDHLIQERTEHGQQRKRDHRAETVSQD